MADAAILNQLEVLTRELATIKANQATKFNLSSNDIIRTFDNIAKFSGEDNYKLKSFLKSVKSAEDLCGDQNYDLKAYCLTRVINGQIIGRARNAILEIPEGERSWTNVVQTLSQRFRPKQTIHQLLYFAKELKVFNLKDLFNKLNEVKSNCNEICDFDDESAFTYNAIDKEIVQILKNKIIPIVQLQIDQSKTLTELENILCQSEIYTCADIIKFSFRLNTQRNGNTGFNRNPTQNRHQHNKPHQNNNYSQNNSYPQNYSGSFATSKHNLFPQNNSSQNYSGQFSNPRNNHFQQQHFNQSNSGQFSGPRNNNFQPMSNKNHNNSQNFNRIPQSSGQFRNNSAQVRRDEPMEIDNINQSVNFTEEPRRANYQ